MKHSLLAVMAFALSIGLGFNSFVDQSNVKETQKILNNASAIYIEKDLVVSDILDSSMDMSSRLSDSAWVGASDKKEKVFLDCARRQTEEMKCMICNSIAEAHNQSFEGQVLVNVSVLKRILSKDYPNSACDVVYQKWQYSWTQFPQNYAVTVSNLDSLKKALLIAQAEVNNYPCLTHYHNHSVLPNWHDDYAFNRVEGDHYFYNTGHCRKAASSLKLALNIQGN